MFCLSVLEQGSRSSSRSSSPSVRMPPPEKTCSRAYFSPEDPTGTPAPVLPGSLSSSPDVSSQSCRLLLTQHLFQTVLSRLYLVFWGDGLLLKQPDTLRRSGKLCWSSCSNSLFLLRHQRLRQLHSHGVSHPGSPAAGRPAHVHVRLHVCLYRWTVYRSQDQSNEPIELRLTCVSMSVARHLVNVLSRPGLQSNVLGQCPDGCPCPVVWTVYVFCVLVNRASCLLPASHSLSELQRVHGCV